MKTYELMPDTKQKSFYGKARVIIDDNGTETLFSYDTAIIRKTPEGKLIRLWDDWSATTGKHIKAYCGLNKAGYKALSMN